MPVFGKSQDVSRMRMAHMPVFSPQSMYVTHACNALIVTKKHRLAENLHLLGNMRS